MINALITKHLGKAFDNQLRDAVYPFTGTRKGAQGNYNPVTGEYDTAINITYTGRGTLEDYTIEEQQATQIEISDMKLSALQAEVTNSPKIDDIITVDGQNRRVMNVSPDGVKAMWIMQLRGLNVG